MEPSKLEYTPSANGITPDPHQIEGRDFLAGQNYAILGDDPRLGKCGQTIMAADKVGAAKILVICPAIGREHWRDEWHGWQKHERRVFIWRHNDIEPHWELGYKNQPHVLIISYDLLSHKPNAARYLADRHPQFDLVVLDECHRLKTVNSNRTKAVYGKDCFKSNGIVDNASRVWLLTGTPAPNNAGELYPHIRSLFPQAILVPAILTHKKRPMTQGEFNERYCKIRHSKKFGPLIVGSKNLPELRERLKPYILRRREKDVKGFLPEMRVTVERLDKTFMTDIEPAETALTASYPWMSNIEAAMAQAVKDKKFSTAMRLTGIYKLPAVKEWVCTQLDDGVKKLIVFGIHHDVLDPLTEKLAAYNPVQVDGRVSDKKAQTRIAQFQEDPACRVFVGQVQACSEAICLDATSRVAFAETPWVPFQVFQAASRARSKRSQNKVLAQLLTMPGTRDNRVLETVRRKVDEINELFG